MNGNIVIYRPVELINMIVYGRIFTAWNTKTSTSITPEQLIQRTNITSDLKQIPGSALMIKRAAKKITINQDYGYKESWIENGEFKPETYDSGVFKFSGWTYQSGLGYPPLSNIIPGEKDGLALFSATGTPNAYNISQSFGTYAKATTDMIVIELEYLLYNYGTVSDNVTIYIMVKSNSGSNYLSIADGMNAVWTNGSLNGYITFTETVLPGTKEWKSFRRSINGLPVNGPYTIYIHTISAASSYLGVKNIKFYSTSDEIVKIKFPWYKISKFKRFLFQTFGTITPKSPTYDVYKDLQEIVARQYILENAINGTDITEDYLLVTLWTRI